MRCLNSWISSCVDSRKEALSQFCAAVLTIRPISVKSSVIWLSLIHEAISALFSRDSLLEYPVRGLPRLIAAYLFEIDNFAVTVGCLVFCASRMIWTGISSPVLRD